ncbi:hypothetical protein [Streptomyces flaveolus]|uniref:hypothetical protein n=1 Tax=Streptomyces flaveolus TaxID=67297 RepID=UPI0033E21107
MNTTPAVTAGAVTFVWLGMVLAISFLEAPLKFRAPGVTIPVGLGIGRLVFRALNAVEAVLAVVVVLAVALGDASAAVIALTAAVAALLLAQLAVVRPLLNRRSDRVLAGEELPRSRSHLWYVALEVLKAGTLVALGVALLTA